MVGLEHSSCAEPLLRLTAISSKQEHGKEKRPKQKQKPCTLHKRCKKLRVIAGGNWIEWHWVIFVGPSSNATRVARVPLNNNKKEALEGAMPSHRSSEVTKRHVQ